MRRPSTPSRRSTRHGGWQFKDVESSCGIFGILEGIIRYYENL
jgi:hypothetical protein